MFWRRQPKPAEEAQKQAFGSLELLSSLPVTLSDAQLDSLAILKRIEYTIGEHFVLIDDYSTGRIRFWHLASGNDASLQSRVAVIGALAKENVIVTIQFRSKRMKQVHGRASSVLMALTKDAIEAMATIRFVPEEIERMPSLSGRRSTIEIEFIIPDPDGAYTCREYSFVQTSLTASEINDLPSTYLLGHEFKAVRSLTSYHACNTIPREFDLVISDFESRWTGTDRSFKACRLHTATMSALIHLRGLRRIVILTDEQPPKRLLDLDTRIEAVSCNSLEEALLKVLPDADSISERFLWLREGIFFIAPMTAYQFFDEYGRARYFPSTSNVLDSTIGPDAESVREAFAERFGAYITRRLKHAPIAMEKAVLQAMREDLSEPIRRIDFQNPLPELAFEELYCHYAAALGRAVEGEIAYRYFNVNAQTFQARMNNLARSRDCDIFCVRGITTSHFSKANEAFCLSRLPRLFAEREPKR